MAARGIRLLVVILLAAVGLVGLFLLLSPPPTETQPQTRKFNLNIRRESMTPSKVTVREGDRVTFRITSDPPVEVHLHGYDLEREVELKKPAELSFEANLTGRFEIEDHDTEEELGTLVVEPR